MTELCRTAKGGDEDKTLATSGLHLHIYDLAGIGLIIATGVSSTAGKISLSHRLKSHSSFKQSHWRFALRFILITGNNGAHHQIR